MFNKDQKEKFLKYIYENEKQFPFAVDSAATCFKMIEKYEETENKDISKFEDVEIASIYENDKYSVQRLMEMTTVMQYYIDWVNLDKEDKYNPFKKIRRLDIVKIKQKEENVYSNYPSDNSRKIIGKRDFDKIYQKLSSQKKLFLLCLFEGMEHEEFFLMKKDRIDFQKKTIKLFKINEKGEEVFSREFKLQDEMLKVIEELEQDTLHIYGDRIIKNNQKQFEKEIFTKARLKTKRQNFIRQVYKAAKDVILIPKWGINIELSGLLYNLKILAANEGVAARQASMLDEGEELLDRYNVVNKPFFRTVYREYL